MEDAKLTKRQVEEALEGELKLVWAKWIEIEKIREHWALLYKMVPHFARIVITCLFEAVILHLSRLSDPPEWNKHKRLTFRQLSKFNADNCPAIQDVRKIRNEWIGHLDLQLASQFVLQGKQRSINAKKIVQVLEYFATLVNHRPFERSIRQSGTDKLAYYLKKQDRGGTE